MVDPTYTTVSFSESKKRVIVIFSLLLILGIVLGIIYNLPNKSLIPSDYEPPTMSKEQLYQYAQEEADFYDKINYTGSKTYYINMK